MDALNIKVIELADFVAGPYCGKLLADFYRTMERDGGAAGSAGPSRSHDG